MEENPIIVVKRVRIRVYPRFDKINGNNYHVEIKIFMFSKKYFIRVFLAFNRVTYNFTQF